ncbi:MAG: DUF3368 domain-containing protein [Oscillospiraceae bacterium]|nr:DUF3368 domain-containing protein [Oscillospiraceae bacterium]
MIKVICNASPIIGLVSIGKLNLLWEIFDEVLIPEAVYQEVTAGNRTQDIAVILDAINNGNIKVIKIHGKDIANLLYGKLHRGELETVIGAKEDPTINLAIIDEKAARTFAATMLVDTLGLLGILIHAKATGLIEAVRPCLDKLISNGYWVSHGLYKQVLSKVDEL